MALEVDGDDGVPLVLGHVHEHPVAQDPGVVDEDVEASEVIERLPDEPRGAGEVGDVLAVRGRLAALCLDLVDDLLRGGVVVPLAGERGAEIVDDDLRACLGERERVCAADPSPGARDDRDLPRQIWHRGESITLTR